jgi:hypothetical protein
MADGQFEKSGDGRNLATLRLIQWFLQKLTEIE